MTHPPHLLIGRVLLVLAVVTLPVACGDDNAEPQVEQESDDTSASEDTEPTAEASTEATFLTACELFPEDEAEAIIGTDLELLEASDDFRCSYVAVDGGLAGAVLSVLPTAAKVEDLDVVRNAYQGSTIEEIPGLGDAGFYHDDGPIHDVQFVKGDIWVTIGVAELVGSDDYRAAALQIAHAAADRL